MLKGAHQAGIAERRLQLQERDGYAKELEDLIPQMEQLVADKQSLEAQLNGQEPELKRLRERCSQLQSHLETGASCWPPGTALVSCVKLKHLP